MTTTKSDWRVGLATLVAPLLLSACSFLDDFDDFSFAPPDGGLADGTLSDAGFGDSSVVDSGASDSGGNQDGGECVPPSGTGPQCPTACLGDAIEDFRPRMQAVGTLKWRYLEDNRGGPGLNYSELIWGTFGDRTGFVDSAVEGAPPSVIPCSEVDNACSAACAGIEDALLLTSDEDGAGSDATIELTVPSDGVYRIPGWFRTADGVSAALAHQLLITRGGRSDLIALESFDPSPSRTVFAPVVQLLGGDVVRITVRPAPGTSGTRPVGLRVGLEPTTTSGDCLFAVTFDGEEPLVDRCGGRTLTNRDEDGGAGTTSVPSAAPWFGNARSIDEGQHLISDGRPLDYRGDFTVQLWAQVTNPTFANTLVFSDQTSSPKFGGIAIDLGDDTDTNMVVGALYGGSESAALRAPRKTDRAWHFYRVVRSAADNELRLCIDGDQVASAFLPGGEDLSSSAAPRIGGPTFNYPQVRAVVDDVRVFAAALPCF